MNLLYTGKVAYYASTALYDSFTNRYTTLVLTQGPVDDLIWSNSYKF